MKNDQKLIPFPLSIFYDQKSEGQPVFKVVSAKDIPEPQRTLLCHTDDMTPTLEKYHNQTAHLSILGKQPENGYMFRKIALVDENGNPLEMGAIKIQISNFPQEAQELIYNCEIPLGTIYKMFSIPRMNKPLSYYRINSDDLMNKIFHLKKPTILYGRLNSQVNKENTLLALALEILPPLQKKMK